MLAVEELTKRYLPPPPLLRPLVRSAAKQPVDALRGVSFRVEPGEIVGLIGPNGAGKTTIIKILATLLEPSTGTATVAGFDVTEEPNNAKQAIGLVLSEDRGVYWRLSGRRNLEFFGVLAGLRRADARRRVGEVLELVGLADDDKLVFGYSSGMRSRLQVGRALLGDPAALILDEPTRSLDPLASADVNRMLRGLADSGRAVLLSSHRLDEVASICDRVVLLVGGTVRYQGPADDPRALSDLLSREAGR